MNNSRLAVMIVVVSAGSAMAAVNPTLLGLVMPDAKILSGVQVQQAESSPFGQYVLSQIQFNDNGFQKFLAATGFDPRHDLTEVLAATNADSTTTQKNGIVLGRGTFQPTLIAAAATVAGGSVTQYGGINVITAPRHGNPLSIAFLDASTVVIGGTDPVEATIDRLAGPAYSGPLAQAAVTASAANQAWFATTTPLSEFLNGKLGNATLGGVTQGNLLQAVIAASGGLNFGSSAVTISADAVTTSAQNAQSLADVLKFVVGMLQTNAQNKPALGALASSATFTVNGAVMHVAMSLPEQQIEQLFVPGAAGAKRRVAER
jgi:hypothetical protein